MEKITSYFYSGEEMPCKRYYIDYGAGAGNEEVTGTIAEAMRVADKGARYTGKDIRIYVADAYEAKGPDVLPVAVRHWWNYAFDEDAEENGNISTKDVIEIGEGYFDAWRVREDDEEVEAEYECRVEWSTYCAEMY